MLIFHGHQHFFTLHLTQYCKQKFKDQYFYGIYNILG